VVSQLAVQREQGASTMKSGNSNLERFVAFLLQLASGSGSASEWERVVVAHSSDPRLEESRRELVRAAIVAEDWSWDSPPQSLRDVARGLYERLRLGQE
jgi:hypothetical protein